ncbi:MAG: D-glycero-beta-D-manno-heptose 1,7-bisphosphate 7-phosphatase [Gammaproteobacteria bacterium]|nr:D-glycero-beta-D-manno-heptose 1,7-bisphosphate 7-phosphatase [Pseudomonadales bacterium]MCP5347764.1 D-glycero-beta-D-manno-heptose 1,7-bisphosphate 7-phosphatase [Pseudomonadales bacterium]
MKLVILDRDGVINQDSDDYIKSPEEWIPIERSLAAIAALSQAGFRVAVATNQSGIARGLFDSYTLARIHQKMCSLTERAGGVVDAVFYCPHGPDEGCHCRKPEPGLLEEISREFDVPLQGVPFVGDSLKDLQVAKTSGCIPFLVLTGKGEQTRASCSEKDLLGVQIVDDLHEAVKRILSLQLQ